jgi:hypothetical protein
MQVTAGQLAVEQLDTADLDNPVAALSVQSRGFSIQKNLSHKRLSKTSQTA